MKQIQSFSVNHLNLLRGIYLSRRDPVGDEVVTTFDIRLKLPNREPAMSGRAIHTMEHLAATFLRNHPVWGERIVYWGPMGCLTGNYLILKGDWKSEDIVDLMKETFAFIADFEGDIPGATPAECGNYSFNDLPLCKAEAKKFLEEVLEKIGPENLNYPD